MAGVPYAGGGAGAAGGARGAGCGGRGDGRRCAAAVECGVPSSRAGGRARDCQQCVRRTPVRRRLLPHLLRALHEHASERATPLRGRTTRQTSAQHSAHRTHITTPSWPDTARCAVQPAISTSTWNSTRPSTPHCRARTARRRSAAAASPHPPAQAQPAACSAAAALSCQPHLPAVPHDAVSTAVWQMMAALLCRVLAAVRALYGVMVARSDVVVLDSSTPAKFSRHLIVRIPGATFMDNQHSHTAAQHSSAQHTAPHHSSQLHSPPTTARWCDSSSHRPACVCVLPALLVGGFVRHLVWCWMEEDERAGGGRLPWLVFASEPSTCPAPRRSPVIDLGVYSRHRSFRLLWSSKHKAHAPILHVHHTNAYRHAASHRATFTHSTVQFHVPQHTQPAKLTWPPNCSDDEQLLTSSDSAALTGSHHRTALTPAVWMPSARCLSPSASSSPASAALPCGCSRLPSDVPLCSSSLRLLERWIEATFPADPLFATVRRWSTLSLTAQRRSGDEQQQQQQPCTALPPSSPSPPSLAEHDGRAPVYLLLLAAVQGSRWCGRVERAHRSNAVYLLVHVHTGASSPSSGPSVLYTQRCHDPDCKGFTSAAVDAPPHIAGAVQLRHTLQHTHGPVAQQREQEEGGQRKVDASEAG